MMYRIGWILSFIISRLRVGVRVFGSRHIPARGAFILAMNHESNMDPFVLASSFLRPMEFMAKEELFRHPFSRWVFTGFHAHPVRRGNGDYRALKESLRILSGGKGLLIFPEGTRSKTGQLQAGKAGVGFLVCKSKAPVIPAYIDGSYEAMPEGLDTLKRGPVTIRIGEPMTFDHLTRSGKDHDSYQAISDEIMARIAQLKEEQAAAGACDVTMHMAS